MNEELKKLEELLANDRKIIEDNYKEIERLKGALQTHEILLRSNTKEIERLNNIINELEHDFESYELEYLQDTYQGSLTDFIETELERIQELKGDGSNE